MDSTIATAIRALPMTVAIAACTREGLSILCHRRIKNCFILLIIVYYINNIKIV